MKDINKIELLADESENWRHDRLNRVLGYYLGLMKTPYSIMRLIDQKGILHVAWEKPHEPSPSMRHAMSEAWEEMGNEPYDNVKHDMVSN